MKYEKAITRAAINLYKAVYASSDESRNEAWIRVVGQCEGIAWALDIELDEVWDDVKHETERLIRDSFDDDRRTWDRWNNFWK